MDFSKQGASKKVPVENGEVLRPCLYKKRWEQHLMERDDKLRDVAGAVTGVNTSHLSIDEILAPGDKRFDFAVTPT